MALCCQAARHSDKGVDIRAVIVPIYICGNFAQHPQPRRQAGNRHLFQLLLPLKNASSSSSVSPRLSTFFSCCGSSSSPAFCLLRKSSICVNFLLSAFTFFSIRDSAVSTFFISPLCTSRSSLFLFFVTFNSAAVNASAACLFVSFRAFADGRLSRRFGR